MGTWRAENELAGLSEALQSLRELVLWPTTYAEEAASLGLRVSVKTALENFRCRSFGILKKKSEAESSQAASNISFPWKPRAHAVLVPSLS